MSASKNPSTAVKPLLSMLSPHSIDPHNKGQNTLLYYQFDLVHPLPGYPQTRPYLLWNADHPQQLMWWVD